MIGVAIVAYIVHQFAQPVHGRGHQRADVYSAAGGSGHGHHSFVAKGGAAGLYRRQPGDVDRRRHLESGQCSAASAPVASIGGAGTFDGVFLAGILAVLLAPTVSHSLSNTNRAD